jgi:protein TonB
LELDMAPHAEDRNQFLGGFCLSLLLHLWAVGALSLGVLSTWGRTYSPPPVLEVSLVAGLPPGEKLNPAPPGPAGAATSRPAPQKPPKKKAPAAKKNPKPEPRLVKAPAPRPAAASVAPRAPLPGPAPAAAASGRANSSGALAYHPSTASAPGAALTGSGLGGGGSGGTGGGGSAFGRYLGLVRARILAHRHYPPQARERRQEGVVRLRFTLSPTGAVQPGVTVVQPSGVNSLDEQAKTCVLTAAPFPPFPPELKQDHLSIEVPIAYKLMEDE